MIKLITFCSDFNSEGLDNLLKSCDKFGWDVSILSNPWRGFGTKLIETYNYFKQNPDVKELIFVDAYDVLILSTPKEVEEKLYDRSKMLVSVEKACYPDSDLASKYPETNHEWKYVNSGTYYAPREVFIQLFESNPPQYESDDQLWLSLMFLGNRGKINLDYNCEVFQCYSFIEDDDFAYYDQRVFNLKTVSMPIFLHGNGKTNMDKVLELL